MAFRPPANREALRLYREVLRTAKAFYWNNEQGQPWCVELATWCSCSRSRLCKYRWLQVGDSCKERTRRV